MKVIFTFLTATLLLANLATGQSTTRCSAMEYNDFLVSEGLVSPDQFSQMDQAIQQWIENNPEHTSGAIVTIPVVFHVLYANTNQNISDARIYAQLDVLNQDYSRTNADTNNTPSAFLSVAANTDVQFCLATQDPAGNPTTGIIKKSTTTSSWSTNNNIKSSSTGGSNAWNTQKYLNVWIGNLGSGLLGYATFPTSAGTSNDGIVLHYRSVGGPSSNDAGYTPYHLGRTGTHEVGHWLGLYHTFQGNCSGTTSTTCSSAGDQVCDTPPVNNPNFDCPSNVNSCNETPNLPDMVTNYMDYTDDDCMNIFTQGQTTRVHASINTSRFQMSSSLGCMPVGIASAEALNTSINIFPNPSTGNFTLSTTFQEDTDLNIYIFNILGEQIYHAEKQNVLKSKIDLDLNNFSNGIYYMVLESNGFTTSRKLNIAR